MVSSRRAAVFASAFIVLGGVGFVVGGQMVSADNCESGTYTKLEPVADSNGADLDGNTTAFENLTAVEQRIFLEAHNDLNDDVGYSDTYTNWSEEWFKGGAVEYRGEYYEPRPFVADCGVPTGGLVQIASILIGLIGTVAFAVVAAWRVSKDYR